MRKLLVCATLAFAMGLGCGDDSATGAGGSSGNGGSGGTAGSGGSGGTGGSAGIDAAVDAPDIDAPATDGGGTDGGNSANVTGSWIEQYTTDTALVAKPEDLSGTTPTAVIGAAMYQGTGAVDGTFVIPNVPQATYILRGLTILVTSARVLDLGYDFLGRTDAVAPTSATSMVLSGTAMDAWSTSDVIEVYSSNAGTLVAAGMSGFTSGAPASGATSLTNATIDWLGRGGKLIQMSKSDHVTVSHFHLMMATATTGVWGLTRSFNSTTLEMTNGTNATLSGTFAAAPTAMATFDWRNSQWAGHLADLNLAGGNSNQFLLLQAQPSVSTRGWLSASQFTAPDLVNVITTGSNATDAVVGPVTYGNPFSTLDVVGIAVLSGSRTYTLAGTTTGATVPARIVTVKTRTDFLAGPITPIVTPVQMLKADNVAAGSDLTLGSLTPTISWTAPAVGTPQLYQILVIEATASGTATTLAVRRQYRTTQTSFTVLANHLTSGHKYILQVKAQTATGVDLGASPNRYHLPYADADTLSGILTAP